MLQEHTTKLIWINTKIQLNQKILENFFIL